MLYIALVVSAILLLVVNLIAWRAERPIVLIFTSAFAISILPSVGGLMMLHAVMLQAILVCIAAWIWRARRGKPRHFLVFSCIATLIAFAIPGYFAYRQTRHLQELFSYISMTERLPPPEKQRPTETLPAATANHLATMETLIEDKERSWPSSYRKTTLRQIHEDTVEVFVNQEGFGVARMVGVSEKSLKSGLHDEPPIPQPGTPSASPWLAEQLRKKPFGALFADVSGGLLSLHHDSIVDFINPAGFGYIKDRQHVAGFQEHHFSQAPAPERPWKLQTLDLIGLVLHEKPTAYVSDHLPRMRELKSAPRRDLDEFESAGLPTLQRGEDLFIRERGQERRMLGAIRASRQCLSCHEAKRGDLLGTFSYRMTKDAK